MHPQASHWKCWLCSMYNTLMDTHGCTVSYRRTGWHSLIYLYHKLLPCLYVLFHPAVMDITPLIYPLSHAWIQKPLLEDASDDPFSLHPGTPAIGGWFGNLLGNKSPPRLLFASLQPVGHWIQNTNTKQHSLSTVSYFIIRRVSI